MSPEQIIEILQAYKEGKTIEYYENTLRKWLEARYPTWDFSTISYRIKSEPKYRPYKDIPEFFNAQKEHGPYLRRICKNDIYKTYVLPISIREDWVGFNKAVDSDLNSETEIPIEYLLSKYVWQDETPCGILEE